MRGMNRNLTIAFVLLVSLGHPVTTFAVDFSSPKSYPVGTSPAAVAVGDFNGDGKLDIAVANSGSGNVGILLGNGDGTFQAAVNFDAGMASPRSVAMGDFNHDGKMDLAVFQPSLPTDSGTLAPGALSILLGNGDGSFQAAETQALSSTAAGMAVADFNLDGKSDLAVSDSDPNTNILSINIFLGKGDGTFQPGKQTSLPSGSNTSFTAADLNRDSKPDLAVGSSSGFVILLGKCDGTFQAGPATAVADGFVVQNVQAEDVNGDGSVDLVVESFHFQGPPPGQNEGATSRADHISFFLGNGNGTFQGEQIIATSRWRKATVFSPPVGDSIESLILGDYNGDGKLDLAYPRTRFFADRTRRTSLEIRLGKGDGTFSPIVALPGPGIILAAADLNSDKLSDLVVTGSGSDIGVVLNASPTSGADLGLVAAGASNDPAGVGTNLTYTAIVLNEGPQDATAVTFTDTLPNSANFISATTTQGSCSQSRGIVTCNIGVLASAYDATVTIVVTPMATRTITNTMNVTATAPDLASANNSATQVTTVQPVFMLAVIRAGSGSGAVTSAPGGIDCGSTCSAAFLSGTVVTLSATPSNNSTFAGWSGGCTGTGSCTMTMNADQSMTATFNLPPDFSLIPAATNLTMQRGGQVSDVLTFPAQGGFSGTIALACSVSGPSPTPTCGISPNSVTPGGSATLAVNAAALAAEFAPPLPFERAGDLYATLLPLGMLGCVLATSFDKKRRRLWALCLLMLAATILPTACGGGNSVTKVPPPQNYTVTVTATSGAIQHSTPITVTVQ